MKKRKNPKFKKPEKIKKSPPKLPKELVNKTLMTRFEVAFMSKDIKGIVACLAPGFCWQLPNGEQYAGRKRVKQVLKKRLYLASGPKFSNSKFHFFGNTVIQKYRVLIRTPDGGVRKLKGLDVYKIRDGRILSKDAYWKS